MHEFDTNMTYKHMRDKLVEDNSIGDNVVEEAGMMPYKKRLLRRLVNVAPRNQ